MDLKFLAPLPILFTAFLPSFAQAPLNFPLENTRLLPVERRLPADSLREHTAIKPLLFSPSAVHALDSFYRETRIKLHPFSKAGSRIMAGAIVNLQAGVENGIVTWRRWTAESGVQIRFHHKDKIGASVSVLSGLAHPPFFGITQQGSTYFTPGTGQGYYIGNNNVLSYQSYSGYLSYSPSRVFNLQAGRDRHFWGDGYRSLFLSDQASPFSFLKLSATAWRFKYVSLFAAMSDRTDGPFQHQRKNKYGTFHYLSWNVSRRVNFGLFESIIWQGDHPDRDRGFDVSYLNPVIFFRPVEYSLGSSDNSFLGGSFRIKLGEEYKTWLYGQAILDEFLLKEVLAFFGKLAHLNDPNYLYGWWGNKQGVQLGVRAIDMFRLKNLDQRLEFNAVRPYTYSHGSVQQNYAHANQPLAHPLGANFTELVSITHYRYERFSAEWQLAHSVFGLNQDGNNWGQNIFQSYTTHPKEYGNAFWQGLKTQRAYTHLKLRYSILPAEGWEAEAGMAWRRETNSQLDQSLIYLLIGIRTALCNRYSDY